jgi:hypothetical protein
MRRAEAEMELAAIDGIEVEYELRGSGEPVVVIHWGVSARWAEPLLAEPILAERYRVLRDLVLAWLPRVEPFDLPGATHLLHIERPHEMAEALSSFFARHPLEPSS